jgi:hypothetical protein
VEVDTVDRWWAILAAAIAVTASGAFLLFAPGPAEASDIYAKVSPNQHLSHGQWVTVSGHGLPHIKGQTWFVDQCTSAVRHRMNPRTDTQHCDLTASKVIKLKRNGSFSLRYRVIAGIVGDGYCGTHGHLTCVLTVADADGGGTVVRIGFRAPAEHPTTPSSTTSTSSTNNPTTPTAPNTPNTSSSSTTSTSSPAVTSTTA